jgi:hypothetical protein
VDNNRLDHIRSILYNEQTEATRYVVNQLDQFRAKNLIGKIPVSTMRNRGILFAGEQKLAIPMERALRSLHALVQFSTIQQHVFFLWSWTTFVRQAFLFLAFYQSLAFPLISFPLY